MRHNPFKKFLALLLLGAMTAAVGCKDYDDDIDSLNARLDDVQGKIELKADASALTALSAKVDAIDLSKFLTSDQVTSQINSALAGYLKADDLKAEADKLGYQLASDVQAAIDAALAGLSIPSDEHIKDLIDAQLTLANLWTSDLQSKIAALIAEEFKKQELTQSQTNQAVAAVLAALNDDKDVAGIRTAISELVGEEFSTYMADYIKTNAAAWNGQVSDAVAAQLNANNEELKNAIIKAVSGTYMSANDINTLFAEYEKRLRTITGDVEALKNRIQSLVNVPEYMDGTSSMNAYKVGNTELGNCAAVLTYRVAPAALNEDIVSLWENRASNGAEFSMRSEQVSRAAGAAVTITDMKVTGEGLFQVAVIADKAEMAALASQNKTLALALAINFQVATAEEGSEEPVSTVENDITSDYAGIRYDAAQIPVAFKFYKEGEAYEPGRYEIPFNTPVSGSKVTLLEGTEIRAALKDGAFLPLEDINQVLDAAIAAGSYEVTPTYTDPAGQTVAAAQVNTFIIKAETKNRVYNTKLATVEFRKGAKAADVGSEADFAHAVTMKVGSAATTHKVTVNDTYTIVREQGATYSFGEQTIPWTYGFVEAGYPNTTTPAFGADKLDEIAISLVSGTLNGLKIQDVFAAGNLDKAVVNNTPVQTADKPFSFDPFVSKLALGIKISGNADAYEWGESYEVEYTYVKDEIEHKLIGTLRFGAAPADVTYTIAGSTIAYYDNQKNTGSWTELYKAFGQTEGYSAEMFGSANAFKAAALTGASTPTTATIRNPEDEAADVSANASMNIDAGNGKIEGALSKAAIAANGDQFAQESSFTTWYGQTITVQTTYNVDLAAYGLKTNDEMFVSKNVVTLRGGANASGIWAWDEANLPNYFIYTQPEGKAAAEYVFKMVSTATAGEVYPIIGAGSKLDWSSANQRSVKVECSLQFQGTNVQTADEPIVITVQLEEPITTLAQTSTISVPRNKNGNEIDLLTNLKLIDAEGTPWITFDAVSQKWLPTTKNGNTAKEVFNATTGTAQTAGVAFEIVDIENHPKKELLSIADNILTFAAEDATLVKDQTIKVKATFKYQYGEKTAELTVIVTK